MNGSMNMEFFPTASSFRTPSDSGTNDELFPIIINDAINAAYAENKRKLKISMPWTPINER